MRCEEHGCEKTASIKVLDNTGNGVCEWKLCGEHAEKAINFFLREHSYIADYRF